MGKKNSSKVLDYVYVFILSVKLEMLLYLCRGDIAQNEDIQGMHIL